MLLFTETNEVKMSSGQKKIAMQVNVYIVPEKRSDLLN